MPSPADHPEVRNKMSPSLRALLGSSLKPTETLDSMKSGAGCWTLPPELFPHLP